MSPTFRSLSIYNYRLWAAGALVSNVGTWMQRKAQDWLVLTELTHHSASAVGVVTSRMLAPGAVACAHSTSSETSPAHRSCASSPVPLLGGGGVGAACVVVGVAGVVGGAGAACTGCCKSPPPARKSRR